MIFHGIARKMALSKKIKICYNVSNVNEQVKTWENERILS